MASKKTANPIAKALLSTFEVKRRNGRVPKNWLLIVLVLLDLIKQSDQGLEEDDVYTYDYSLKGSRTGAIRKVLEKYALPPNLGMSDEGVTVRGAPGLRMFREIQGGGVIAHLPKPVREALIDEAIELVRQEVLKVLDEKPVQLPSHAFQSPGKFVAALLTAVKNRSQGRVEQALAEAKVQLRFPDTEIPHNSGFAGDKQTGREADIEVGPLRIIVSASPQPHHFQAAKKLSLEGRQVYLIVSNAVLEKTRKRIRDEGLLEDVTVDSVTQYVSSNMKEIMHDLGVTPRDMCMKLLAEYNRRIGMDFDHSLQVVLPV